MIDLVNQMRRPNATGAPRSDFGSLLQAVDFFLTMSRFFCKLHHDMNRVNVFAIHRCINEGYGLVRIFTEKIRISPRKLWRVCLFGNKNRLNKDCLLSFLRNGNLSHRQSCRRPNTTVYVGSRLEINPSVHRSHR